MPDIRGLMNDPDFQRLPPEEQKSLLAEIGADPAELEMPSFEGQVNSNASSTESGLDARQQQAQRIMREGEAQGADMALRNAPAAIGMATGLGPIGTKLLPFLARFGSGVAGRAATGATIGAGGALTGVAPEVLTGDFGGAAKDVAEGAAIGAVGGAFPPVGRVLDKLRGVSPKKIVKAAVPAAAKALTELPKGQLVDQLRRLASRDDASYLAARQIAKEMGEEGKQIWEAVKTARPRHRAGLSK